MSTFARCIYTNTDLDYIYLPEMLLDANKHMEPDLNALELADEVLVYSADGAVYKGTLTATADDVHTWRKLVSKTVSLRLYQATSHKMLHELTDLELDCLLIARGFNS